MALSFLTKIFGTRNDRLLKEYQKILTSINALEPAIAALDEAALRAKTTEFKASIAEGKALDELLPEAFAVVREAAKRSMGLRHFDVQMIGGIALHQGKIAEMGTGEGKTLTSTLPIYLNALLGKGVHVVTVNNYLAARDAQWMGKIYETLGLTVGVNLPNLSAQEKRAAYACDITYGTNTEYGFDYLRDNMVYEASHRAQRELHYAIIDEVDSILIDEARTPLIISGNTEDDISIYPKIQSIIHRLTRQEGEADPITGKGIITPGDYTVDEKARSVHLTEAGHENAESILREIGLLEAETSLYSGNNIVLMHYMTAALRAKHLFLRDQQYVVQDGKVTIVDEFTGRLMPGRRWSEGMMQAIEAKEGVEIQAENTVMGTITFQNYFRLFGKLAGMTGTADTEAYEFQEIYRLETVVIPPNRVNQRRDEQDRVYKTSQERYQAAITDIEDCYQRGQPVLVGTSSIENSELISQLLGARKLPHQVLNAKQHEREADIIAQAGRSKSITIATNMAGRGTDIVLGGNIEKQLEAARADATLSAEQQATKVNVIQEQAKTDHQAVRGLGGLRIIATERHESRRIDNQLRGRSGRQGDPGSSRFYLSLEDPLMRIFAGDMVRNFMDKLKMPEGEAIEAGIVSRSIESAQRKVEAHHFDARKQVLDFDDVANDQRKAIYQQRNAVLDLSDLDEQMSHLRESCFQEVVHQYLPPDSVEEQWDVAGLEEALRKNWQVDLPLKALVEKAESIDVDAIEKMVVDAANASYRDKSAQVAAESFTHFQRMVFLQTLDTHWREHLTILDELRQGIHLRSYAQKQPKQEYKREAFELFGVMLGRVKMEVTQTLMNVAIQSDEDLEQVAQEMGIRGESLGSVTLTAPTETGEVEHTNLNDPFFTSEEGANTLSEEQMAFTGRNEPCPCGSGKKFKNCHGALA